MESLQKAVYGSMQKLSLGIVWRELQVFSKLLYRGRNQHRRDKAFQMLLRVSKDLQKYQAVSLSNIVKKTWKSLLGSEVLSSVGMKSICELSNKLIECALFTAQTLNFIETTFTQVHIRLCMSLFIPFNLLMVASLSRIWYCLRYHLHAISETFSILKSHLPANQKLSPADSVMSSLSLIHRQYLSDALPLSPNQSLGTAVLRIESVDSDSGSKQLSLEPVVKTPMLQAPWTKQQDAPMQETKNLADVNKVEKTPVNRTKRQPNTILCFVKTGKKLLSVRIRCPSYLKTARLRTAFKVRLSWVKLLRCTPWQLTPLVTVYNVKIRPLTKSKAHSCSTVMEPPPKKLSKANAQNDIDDIFSALNV